MERAFGSGSGEGGSPLSGPEGKDKTEIKPRLQGCPSQPPQGAVGLPKNVFADFWGRPPFPPLLGAPGGGQRGGRGGDPNPPPVGNFFSGRNCPGRWGGGPGAPRRLVCPKG